MSKLLGSVHGRTVYSLNATGVSGTSKTRAFLEDLLNHSIVLPEDWQAARRFGPYRHPEMRRQGSGAGAVGPPWAADGVSGRPGRAGTNFGMVLGNYRVLDRPGPAAWRWCSRASTWSCAIRWPSRCCRFRRPGSALAGAILRRNAHRRPAAASQHRLAPWIAAGPSAAIPIAGALVPGHGIRAGPRPGGVVRPWTAEAGPRPATSCTRSPVPWPRSTSSTWSIATSSRPTS